MECSLRHPGEILSAWHRRPEHAVACAAVFPVGALQPAGGSADLHAPPCAVPPTPQQPGTAAPHDKAAAQEARRRAPPCAAMGSGTPASKSYLCAVSCRSHMPRQRQHRPPLPPAGLQTPGCDPHTRSAHGRVRLRLCARWGASTSCNKGFVTWGLPRCPALAAPAAAGTGALLQGGSVRRLAPGAPTRPLRSMTSALRAQALRKASDPHPGPRPGETALPPACVWGLLNPYFTVADLYAHCRPQGHAHNGVRPTPTDAHSRITGNCIHHPS
jgi:hypothetical protein